jgi:hypothetical protein
LTIPEAFARGVDDSGFRGLPVVFEHAEAAAAVPPHHAGCTLVSHDRVLAPYGAKVLWT